MSLKMLTEKQTKNVIAVFSDWASYFWQLQNFRSLVSVMGILALFLDHVLYRFVECVHAYMYTFVGIFLCASAHAMKA